jgi:phosphoribosylformylglycinamidine (FGAM) synthase-like amidotransferase family enzyme
VFGLMPHPERFLRWTQHPQWTRLEQQTKVPLGLQMFNNAVEHAKQNNTSNCVEGTA